MVIDVRLEARDFAGRSWRRTLRQVGHLCCLGSNRADIGKTLLRQRHASRDVAGLAHIDVEWKKGIFAAPLRPPDHPAERRPSRVGAPKAALCANEGNAL